MNRADLYSPDPREISGPEDPSELVGVTIPAERDDVTRMAQCLMEEYALMGYSARHILDFFTTPFYAGSYSLTQTLGRPAIEQLVADLFPQEH